MQEAREIGKAKYDVDRSNAVTAQKTKSGLDDTDKAADGCVPEVQSIRTYSLPVFVAFATITANAISPGAAKLANTR